MLLGLAIMLIIAVVVGHMAWSSSGARKLKAQVAAYQAAGEPIEPGDFVGTNVTDADNAVLDLRRAARSIDQTSDTWKAYEKLNAALPLTDKEIAAIEAALAENLAAFENIDAAMTRTQIDWKLPLASPVIYVLLPDLKEQRQLANLIHHRALLSYTRGDHASALRDLECIEFQARAVAEQPVLVSALVATGLRAMIANAIAAMAPELKIGGRAGEVSPEVVRRLISALLDVAPLRQALRGGLLGERMIQLDTARRIADGTLNINAIATGPGAVPPTPGAALLNVVAKPIALGDGLIMIRHTTDVITAAAKSPDWPAYQTTAPPSRPAVVTRNPVRHFLAAMMLPPSDRAVQTTFRVITDQRMAAVALAIRMYRDDHGRFPESLDQLVPVYLPAVPLDPMASNTPLKYRPDPDRLIVYSVGENGVDDGGSEQTRSSVRWRHRWNTADAVMHLTPQPRDLEDELEPDSGVGAEHLDLAPPPATTQLSAP